MIMIYGRFYVNEKNRKFIGGKGKQLPIFKRCANPSSFQPQLISMTRLSRLPVLASSWMEVKGDGLIRLTGQSG